MDYLIKNYLKTCEAEFSHYGFKRKGKAFVRIVNDVMQNFLTERITSGRVCRVLFAVIPLCLQIENEYVSGGAYSRELRRFETAQGTLVWDGWEYDSKSEESSNACIAEIMRYLKEYLMPFFERANCCKSALSEIVTLDRLFNENRIANLKLHGMTDKAGPNAELNLLDEPKYYMALKNGDYTLALMCRKALLAQNIDSYTSFLSNKPTFDNNVESGKLTEEDRIRWGESLMRRKERMEMLKEDVNRLEAKDTEYFQRLIEENETYSLNNLKSVI